jgi:hypothetical protein
MMQPTAVDFGERMAEEAALRTALALRQQRLARLLATPGISPRCLQHHRAAAERLQAEVDRVHEVV